MNVKINNKLHTELCKLSYKEYLFGSQLHGIATLESDFDYVRVISDSFYKRFNSLAKYYPNIHSFQYDGSNNTQYIWMTESQFYYNLFSGDGNMLADIIILSGEWSEKDALHLTHTYKIIKGYLGVAKRDLKLHGKIEKKRFHSLRSLMMAEKLINKELPNVGDIQMLKFVTNLPSKDKLLEIETTLRERLNRMLDRGEITHYPEFKEEDELVEIMMNSNNIKEFRYG